MTDLSKKMLQEMRGTYKVEGTLLPSLHRHVMKLAAHKDDDRASNIIHPSEMCKSDWCHRHDYYRITDPAPPKIQTTFRMENAYTFGHERHRQYQQWFWDMGILWGLWKCLRCDTSWFELAPDVCPNGHSHKFLRYREVPLVDQSLCIEGHADAVLCIDGEWYMVEIKTIGLGTLIYEKPRLYQAYLDGLQLDQLWYRINRPFGSHLRQGMLYTYLVQDYKLDINKLITLYEFKPTNDVKEFVVDYNPSLIEGRLVMAKEVAKGVYYGRPPERPDWVQQNEGVCKDCEYKATCWGTKDQEGGATPTPRVKRASRSRRRQLRTSA